MAKTRTTYRGRPTKRVIAIRKTKNVQKRGILSLNSYTRPHNFRVTRFTQSYIGGNTGGSTAPFFGALTFKLSDLPNASEFTNLYDQYMIQKVVIELIPSVNVGAAPALVDNTGAAIPVGTVSGQTPMIHSVIDLNDATVPTLLTDLLQYQTYKSTRGFKSHVRTVYKPKYILSNGAGGTAAPQALASKWQATTQVDVVHYGIKWMAVPPLLTYTTSGGSQYIYGNIDLKVTFFVIFKNTI